MKLRKISVRNADTGEFEQILAFKGGDGKTPVKGVDYNTTADRQEIIDAVIGNIPSIDIDGAIGVHNDNPSSHADIRTLIVQYLASSKTYTNEQIALLIGTAPELLNTLEEIAEAILNNESVVDALNDSIANKLGKEEAKALYVALQGYVAYSQSEKDKLEGIDMASKQNKTDDALDTTSKDIVGAINEIKANPTGVYINAKTVENHVLSENIDKGDLVMIDNFINFDFNSKLSEIEALPGVGMGCSFSPNGDYLAVAHDGSPYITIYRRNGDTFSKLPELVGLTHMSVNCSFSPDGNYLAVSCGRSPFIAVYKRNGDTFSKLPAFAALPNYSMGCSFSPDGNYLAVVHAGSPYIAVYKRNGDTFSKLSAFEALPSMGMGCSFSPNGDHLAVAHYNSPFITVYRRNGDTFSKLPALEALPSTGYDCSFTPDGNYLAVSYDSSPYIAVYKRNGDTFSKLPALEALPSTGNDCSFSPDGNYLAVVHAGSPHITIYRRDGDTFSKLSALATLLGAGKYCSFSPDGNYLAISQNESPFITVYKPFSSEIKTYPTIKRTKDTLSKGIALEQGIAGETKPILITEKY